MPEFISIKQEAKDIEEHAIMRKHAMRKLLLPACSTVTRRRKPVFKINS